jgi:hypothetical protein
VQLFGPQKPIIQPNPHAKVIPRISLGTKAKENIIKLSNSFGILKIEFNYHVCNKQRSKEFEFK